MRSGGAYTGQGAAAGFGRAGLRRALGGGSVASRGRERDHVGQPETLAGRQVAQTPRRTGINDLEQLFECFATLGVAFGSRCPRDREEEAEMPRLSDSPWVLALPQAFVHLCLVVAMDRDQSPKTARYQLSGRVERQFAGCLQLSHGVVPAPAVEAERAGAYAPGRPPPQAPPPPAPGQALRGR